MKDQLKFTLSLKGPGGEIKIPCGNITGVHAAIHTYGFEGKVEFSTGKTDPSGTDTAMLTKPDVLTATLTIGPEKPKDGVKPLTLQGIVLTLTLLDQITKETHATNFLIQNKYSVTFKDPAQATWSQHFPVGIYTDATLKSIVDEFTDPSFQVKTEWEEFTKQRPLIALGLGADENAANFYSFFTWFLNKERGVFTQNYKAQTIEYSIDEKKSADGKPTPIVRPDVEQVINSFPEIPRRDINIHNSLPKLQDKKTIPGENTYPKVSRDYLLSTELTSDVDARADEVKILPDSYKDRLHVYFKHFPIDYTPYPNDLYSFEDKQWSNDLTFKPNIYRLLTLWIDLNATNSDFVDKNASPSMGYEGTIQATFERKEEALIDHPPFTPPKYPFCADGLIVSDKKDKKNELAFLVQKDEKSNLEHYSVAIPRWENKIVSAPFEPLFYPQFYFPLCKDNPVVLEFSLFDAKIKKSIEWWQPTKSHPITDQANKIVFTPRREEAITFLEHTEKDDLNTLLIRRESKEKIQLIRFEEEGFFIVVTEKDKEEKPKCIIHVDNDFGITITSQDADADKERTVKLETDKISTLCKSGGDQATIEQTPTDITIKCKNFTLDAETTQFTSSKETTCKGDKVTVDGANGVKIASSASVEVNGSSSVDVKGGQINLG